jgi:hypothetical protein
MDSGKFQGMRIKVSAPPKARFINPQTIACSNFDTARVIIEIEGMPPYDLFYTLDGVEKTWHIEPGDLSDLDGDGKVDDIAFYYSGLDTITTDIVYNYRLVRVESGGVVGDILSYSSHDLIVHVQPPAPIIRHEWTEVTIGSTHSYYLDNPGVNPEEWFWNIRDIYTNLVNNYNSTTQSYFQVTFNNLIPGWYYVEAQYRDTLYGCYSPFDSLNIELFDIPTIAFSDSSQDVKNCSATMPLPDGQFDFVVEYTGALTYGYSYEVYNYYSDVPEYTRVIDYLTNRSDTIHIDNTFINYTEQNQPWKVKIYEAHNEEGVNVNITDSVRIIMIYPKPIIYDDIDFAN